MRGKPKPKDVEEKGVVGDEGEVVEPPTGKWKGRNAQTVKQAEEEDKMDSVKSEAKTPTRKRSSRKP